MTIHYNVTGPDRKKLVTAISQELNAPVNYQGAPTFAYEIGEYRIDKTGTVTGPDNRELIDALAEPHGFAAITGEYEDTAAEAPETAPDAPEAATDADYDQHHPGQYSDAPPTAPEPPDSDEETLIQTEAWREGEPGPGQLSIDIPLDGYTPEAIDNLCKLILSKEVLIKKALGAEELPIRVLEDRISFPWLKADTESDHIIAYAAFITHLADTAKNKKRVTAKPQESFENEKFAMRVWLIGLGLIGKEFNLTRKLLMANLDGNSSWRYGAPEKAVTTEEPAPAPAEAAPTDEPAPVGAEPNNLAETLADAALIHALNESFENDGDMEAQGDE